MIKGWAKGNKFSWHFVRHHFIKWCEFMMVFLVEWSKDRINLMANTIWFQRWRSRISFEHFKVNIPLRCKYKSKWTLFFTCYHRCHWTFGRYSVANSGGNLFSNTLGHVLSPQKYLYALNVLFLLIPWHWH